MKKATETGFFSCVMNERTAYLVGVTVVPPELLPPGLPVLGVVLGRVMVVPLFVRFLVPAGLWKFPSRLGRVVVGFGLCVGPGFRTGVLTTGASPVCGFVATSTGSFRTGSTGPVVGGGVAVEPVAAFFSSTAHLAGGSGNGWSDPQSYGTRISTTPTVPQPVAI